ncbi:CDF family Co(II)/Ni(II) efflux transporter DmeF [uncultured Phyllobacterium sp.]|uniref:CDF family Co(II)/Ni(II) efflux transporter DmeF n=1 Tax=uncultured Phyllobacterium sp. TaxID=253813 RepID=UPI0025896A56|nr:CDF family Co(II)/Ni(II) efflux transporter DmeF [uncultured Phyllobacterium sp.]
MKNHHAARSNTGSHDHIFLGQNHARNERRTWMVIALTTVMMIAEIAAGTVYGSMALVADGWHMSTHAAAMLIAALAYLYARKHAHNSRFTFGTGKFGDLAAFASAVVLALIALLIAWESFVRLANPVPINFPQAISIAVVGLAVNLLSAWLLRDDHSHHGDHDHHHDHAHAHAHDNNLQAAYIHVLADALTSVLAIGALVTARLYGWLWLDPAIGIIGALVIANWSFGLIRRAGGVLLDYVPSSEDLPEEIRSAIEREGDVITDLHVWQLGPGHHGAIVSLVSDHPKAPSSYRAKLSHIHDLSHVTVEVEHKAA